MTQRLARDLRQISSKIALTWDKTAPATPRAAGARSHRLLWTISGSTTFNPTAKPSLNGGNTPPLYQGRIARPNNTFCILEARKKKVCGKAHHIKLCESTGGRGTHMLAPFVSCERHPKMPGACIIIFNSFKQNVRICLCSPPPKKACSIPSVGKVIATVFFGIRKACCSAIFFTKGKEWPRTTPQPLFIARWMPSRPNVAVCSGRGLLFHRDNAPPYHAAVARPAIHSCSFSLVYHPVYSPDLASSDLYLFPQLKKKLSAVSHWCCDPLFEGQNFSLVFRGDPDTGASLGKVCGPQMGPYRKIKQIHAPVSPSSGSGREHLGCIWYI